MTYASTTCSGVGREDTRFKHTILELGIGYEADLPESVVGCEHDLAAAAGNALQRGLPRRAMEQDHAERAPVLELALLRAAHACSAVSEATECMESDQGISRLGKGTRPGSRGPPC